MNEWKECPECGSQLDFFGDIGNMWCPVCGWQESPFDEHDYFPFDQPSATVNGDEIK